MNQKIGRDVGKLGLYIRKNLPNILTFTSALTAVGASVLSAKAAYKSVPTIEKHKEAMEQLHANKDKFDDIKEYNKETALVYKDTAIELAKDYWPAAITLGLSLASIFTTNQVHKKRYLTMAGMYTAVMTAYNEYRNRVSEKYGEDAERDLYLNLQREEVVTVETSKNGKEKTKVDVITKPTKPHDETFSVWLIDRTNKEYWYNGRPDLTLFRLEIARDTLTTILRTKGYLFLNEALRTLGYPEVPEGQFIGWIYDENKGETDNCVDFGLKEGTENYDLFMSGKNEFVYITFNHDGTIYDKFPLFDRSRIRDNARRV